LIGLRSEWSEESPLTCSQEYPSLLWAIPKGWAPEQKRPSKTKVLRASQSFALRCTSQEDETAGVVQLERGLG